jgi:hypothetical protein
VECRADGVHGIAARSGNRRDDRRAGQGDVNGQSQSQLAVGNQPRGQGRNGDAVVTAAAGIFRTDNPAADHAGGNKIELFGDLLADAMRHVPAAGTGRQSRFDRDGLSFQMLRQRMPPPARGLAGIGIRSGFFGQDLIAIGRRTFGLGFHIVDHVLELPFLFGGQPVGPGAKDFPLQFRDLSFIFGDPFHASFGQGSKTLQ